MADTIYEDENKIARKPDKSVFITAPLQVTIGQPVLKCNLHTPRSATRQEVTE